MAEENPRRLSTPRVSLEDKSNPKESRVFVGAPDYRVFIWGIEVTSDVFSVSTTLTLDDAVSTAMINIVNDNEKWILPTGFAASNIDVVPDELSESPLESGKVGGHSDTLLGLSPGTNTKDPTRKYITPTKFARLKRRNMLRRLNAAGVTVGGPKTTGQALLAKLQSSNLFPFLPGSALIQMADPIRVFYKNPWNIEGEEWYFGFTGYVATVTEDFDAKTNRSILRLACEDIRRLLRYMRTSTNPNVFDLNVLPKDQEPITGEGTQQLNRNLSNIAKDLVINTGNAALAANMTLVGREDNQVGVFELLLFGDTSGIAINRGQSGDPAPSLGGVLGFKEGGKKLVTLTVDGNFEKNLSQDAAGEQAPLNAIYPVLTPAEVGYYGTDWALGDITLNPLQTPAGANVFQPNRLWVILPDIHHLPNFRHPADWGMRIDYFSEFRSRLDILNEFVKNMDFIWYATPKGDIVVEFPNYDCIPQLHAEPWNSILSLQNEFTRFSLTEDDRNIKTLTIMTASGVEGQDRSKSEPFLATIPLQNPELIARYGIREQRSTRPFFYNPKEIPGALAALAAMAQELANADAYRLEGLEMLPNFRAAPGRPYFFKFRNMIGFCEMVQHQIVWNELAQTVYGFKYLRHFDAAAKDWQKISGNYGWHWKPPQNSVTSSVVNNTAKGLDFVQGSKNSVTLSDPTPTAMEEVHQSIIAQEISGGSPLLTQQEHDRLNSITQKMKTSSLTAEGRLSLINEYNSVISKVGLSL